MVNALPRTPPTSPVDQRTDAPGVSRIDPSDPAAPMYRLLAVMRTPLALIVGGTHDPLVDDNRAFAEKLRAAGNERVELFVREGMPHGYYFFPHVFSEGDEVFQAIAAFLSRELGARGTPAATT